MEMLRISRTAQKKKKKEIKRTILPEADPTRLLINRICKRQATFFGHVLSGEELEYLVTTGMIEGKRSMRKQREKMLDGLTQ